MSDRIAERLTALIKKGDQVLRTHVPNPPGAFGFPTLDSAAYQEWRTQVLAYLSQVLGSGHVYTESFRASTERGAYQVCAEEGTGILRAVLEDARAGALPMSLRDGEPAEHLLLLEQICSRFHLVARQLRARHSNRPTLSVTDEYDVQDLLHALLLVHFDDIRREEGTPSYAGKSARVDFLLKVEQIIVETKKSRATLNAATLGDELMEDIERYGKHPDCKALVCFVYDPDGFIANPRGVESDLKRDSPFPVRVLIRPR